MLLWPRKRAGKLVIAFVVRADGLEYARMRAVLVPHLLKSTPKINMRELPSLLLCASPNNFAGGGG